MTGVARTNWNDSLVLAALCAMLALCWAPSAAARASQSEAMQRAQAAVAREDYAAAGVHFEAECAAGGAAGCYNLAILLSEGKLVTADQPAAERAAARARVLRQTAASAAPALRAPAAAADAAVSHRLLNCRAIPEDCAAEIAEVERMIGAVPTLATLRQESNAQIAARKRQPGVTPAAARALDTDETWFRRNLKRELFFAESEAETNRAIVEAAMRSRLDMLRTITLRADMVEGEWRNATGTVIVAALGDGQYRVEANPVDIDDLGWTCELAGTGARTGDRLVADLGGGEILILQVADGILRTEHKAATGNDVPPSQYCGAGGHGGGVWFKSGAP